MEIKLQDQGQFGQDLGYWLSPRGSQLAYSLFSEEKR